MRPFRIEVPQAELDDLRHRLDNTRWPAQLPGAAWSRGTPREYMEGLAEYWRSSYDWRGAERRLNEFPQFTTEVDGANIHFLHVRSPEPNALPLLVTHGWPGSFAEFTDVIGPLTDPAAHGGDPADAFHLVIPSIPGFAFSGPVREPGWNVRRVAGAWASLMERLGYRRYAAQGGDAGSVISVELGRRFPQHVVGVHLNMLMTFPSGAPAELDGLGSADQARLARLARFEDELSGYMKLQSTRPQTLSYGLTDSPVGQLAWIVEKFWDWTDSAQAPEDAVDRDQLLTNVTLYWLTATAGTSANFYYEGAEERRVLAADPVNLPPVEVPVGVAVFPHDIFLPIRRLADRDLPNIVHWSEFDRGGHFAALEQPELLVDDVRSFFRTLRTTAPQRVADSHPTG